MDGTSAVVIDVVDSMLDNIVQFLGGEVESEARGVDLSAEAGPSNIDKDEPDEWTCAICLESVPIANLAVVKGCGHTYCVHCIVHWASTRTSDPRCPTCKSRFSKVLCHTNLDGSFSAAPIEECVVLLARSRWFQNWLNDREHLKRLAQNNPSLAHAASQQVVHRSDQALLQEELAEEALYGYFESQYEEDEVEEMYLSGSRGPRQAFGNRPWGPNGFVASGRRLAAPKLPKTVKNAGGKVAQNHNNGNNQSGKKAGRRAQRKAKRAAADTSDV